MSLDPVNYAFDLGIASFEEWLEVLYNLLHDHREEAINILNDDNESDASKIAFIIILLLNAAMIYEVVNRLFFDCYSHFFSR